MHDFFIMSFLIKCLSQKITDLDRIFFNDRQ